MLRSRHSIRRRDSAMRELDTSWSARLDACLADTPRLRALIRSGLALLTASVLVLLAHDQVAAQRSDFSSISIRVVSDRPRPTLRGNDNCSKSKTNQVPTSNLLHFATDFGNFDPILIEKAPLSKQADVRNQYAFLAELYLRPFAGKKISREMYMEPLESATQGLFDACPGCFVIQVKDGAVYAYDPLLVRLSKGEFRALRMREALYWIIQAVKSGTVTDTELVVSITDSVTTAARSHDYRMKQATEIPRPIFTMCRCNISDNIPFPMIFADLLRRGFPSKYWSQSANKLREWDKVATSEIGAHEQAVSNWHLKKDQAVFRGTIRNPAYLQRAGMYDNFCRQVGRTGLYHMARDHARRVITSYVVWKHKYRLWRFVTMPLQRMIHFLKRHQATLALVWPRGKGHRLAAIVARIVAAAAEVCARIPGDTPILDVQIDGKCGQNSYNSDKMSMKDQSRYKYIVHAEGNSFWADRLAILLFGTSAIVKQITPCGMFFEPLLKPYKHYVPVDYFFRDIVRQVQWARAHDDETLEIVREARKFAGSFLSSAGVQTYVEEVLSQYSRLLPHAKDIAVHPSAIKLYPVK